jgi:hypothetical protein
MGTQVMDNLHSPCGSKLPAMPIPLPRSWLFRPFASFALPRFFPLEHDPSFFFHIIKNQERGRLEDGAAECLFSLEMKILLCACLIPLFPFLLSLDLSSLVHAHRERSFLSYLTCRCAPFLCKRFISPTTCLDNFIHWNVDPTHLFPHSFLLDP